MMYKLIDILNKSYIIYDNGSLFDISNGKFKTQHTNSNGYIDYSFCTDGEKKYLSLHRLVAEAFIPNPENKPCIDHINTIKTDNRLCNLRWVTHQENILNELTYEKINNAKKKPIVGLDKNGNEVCRFNSVKDAVKVGYSHHIASVANGKRNKSGKLYWRWL